MMLICPGCGSEVEIKVKVKRKTNPGPTPEAEVRKKELSMALRSYIDGVLMDYYQLQPGSPGVSAYYRRFCRAARDVLEMAGGDPARARAGTDAIISRMTIYGLDCTLDTVAKHFLDWRIDEKSYEDDTEKRRVKAGN